MMIERTIKLFLASLVASSLVVFPAFSSGVYNLAASAQGAVSAGSLDTFSSGLNMAEIRLYNYSEAGTIDIHDNEPTLTSVVQGIPVVIHSLTRNENHVGEHFDYITEVLDSSGVVVHLDVRYGVAAPLGGQVGIDSSVPVVFDRTGTYTAKVFGVTNLREGPLELLSVSSRSIEVIAQGSGNGQEPETPNIVVIMADDLDQRALDILLDNGLMPNLQRYIIDEGVTFSESFATFPLCCPSRATFLTGQYPHNHNVWSNDLPEGGVTKLDDSSTLATWLQEAGYYTSNVGKYLNGYGNDTPETYIPPGWNDWQATVGSSTYWMYDYTFNDNGVLVKYGSNEGDYQTDVIARRSVEVIDERETSDSTPFFLYINPLAPHEDGKTTICELNYGDIKSTRPAPRHVGSTDSLNFFELMPPSLNEEDVTDKPLKYQYGPLTDDQIACLEEFFHARLESMRAVDDLIGDVMTALSSNNEEKTIVVFTSDNGYLLGEHRLHSKQFIYEESIRLPLYMRIPGVTHKTIDKLVTNNDLAPTFLEFASANAGIQIDGRSLVPLISDPTISWRNGFLIETQAYSAIRTQDYVYALHPTGARELYDLTSDPFQLQSLGYNRDWASKITSLEEWRTALVDCEGAACRSIEDRDAP